MQNIKCIGIGAGKKEFSHANLLRAFIFEQEGNTEQVVELTASIDDSTPEQMGYLMEKLPDYGVKDVYFTPVYMKKNRPAVQLTVLCDEDNYKDIIKLIFRHSSTIGMRADKRCRWVMDRKYGTVKTRYGEIGVKYAEFDDIKKCTVEYESAKQAANQSGCTLDDVYTSVLQEIGAKERQSD